MFITVPACTCRNLCVSESDIPPRVNFHQLLNELIEAKSQKNDASGGKDVSENVSIRIL